MADTIGLSGSIDTKFIKVKDAAVGTSKEIVAAVTSKIPRIYGYFISTDTAGTYTLKIGSTEVIDLYLSANSGFGDKFLPLYISNGTANENVSITKPSGATTSVSLWYTLEVST